MPLQSLPLTSSFSSSTVLLQSNDFYSSRSRAGLNSTICCSSSSRNHAYIPKLGPFSRTKFERGLKDLPLIEKSKNQLADYCSTLEGDASYSCWKAYFELKDLEKEAPKEEIERLIIEAGGVKSLIGCLHGIAEIHKAKQGFCKSKKNYNSEQTGGRTCPVPDGLPKSREELEEEEKARMPDSPFTRLLRTKGTYPAWMGGKVQRIEIFALGVQWHRHHRHKVCRLLKIKLTTSQINSELVCLELVVILALRTLCCEILVNTRNGTVILTGHQICRKKLYMV